MSDLYFRIYGDYREPAPVFYPRAECPWLGEIERHWTTIRDEFVAHRARHRLTESFVPDDVEIHGWRSVNFVTYLHWYRENCVHFPRTVALLRAIPHLTSAFINLLEPRAHLPPHNGDTNATYRCHLGLIIPGDVDQVGLEVGGERRGWGEGEAFAFNEAHRHRVWNDTDRDRAVLVFDVLRPEFRGRKVAICGDVLGAMTLTMLETKLPPLRRLPAPARRGLHRVLGLGARAALVVRDGAR